MAAAGLMTFLVLFTAAYGFASPVAVRITEWGIVKMGHEVKYKKRTRATRAVPDGRVSHKALRGSRL